MPTVSELMLLSGASEDTLWFLRKFGLEFDDDDFEIDKDHKKAIDDLRHKRLSPYVIAYAWRCRAAGGQDDFARYDNLVTIAKIRGFSIQEALSDICARQIDSEQLPTAQYWVDRATAIERHSDAFERLARWSKVVLRAAPPFEVDHTYLAVRLLVSLPCEKMRDYPKPIHRALNRVRHYGLLDGWWRKVTNEAGKNVTFYCRPKLEHDL